jgi:bifunctional NMN adenylyltransferase/nudix hydrolase
MKVGLAVLRAQPFHRGHLALVNKMMASMDVVLVGLGSCKESRTLQNPFPFEQRKEMVEMIFGRSDKMFIFPQEDLGKSDVTTWPEFVMDTIENFGLLTPNYYFAGTEFDACWYEDYANKTGKLEIVIMDRLDDPVRATEIRKMLLIKDKLPKYKEKWKAFVPEILHSYIEENFPSDEVFLEL